jgi:sugar phosphate isomerase/epimerase
MQHKAPEAIEKFGSLIQCTHLHDNAGNDSHQLPMTGDINWKATIGAFKKIGYNGILSIEYCHGKLPEHLAGQYIDLTYKAAEHLWTL